LTINTVPWRFSFQGLENGRFVPGKPEEFLNDSFSLNLIKLAACVDDGGQETRFQPDGNVNAGINQWYKRIKPLVGFLTLAAGLVDDWLPVCPESERSGEVIEILTEHLFSDFNLKETLN